MQPKIAFSIVVLLTSPIMSIAQDFSVRFWTKAQEICIGKDPLAVLSHFPDGWTGWEVCFFQQPDEDGSWIDIWYAKENESGIGPVTTMFREPFLSTLSFPVFSTGTPTGAITDSAHLIRAGVQGPIRMNCVFVNPIENPDFPLPSQGYPPSYEELGELRVELFSKLTASEIRDIGENRFSSPILLRDCDPAR